MKTIIVPTDFSPIAENATRFAVDMAKHINASIMLLHVYQLPVAVNEVPIPMVSADEIQKMSDEKLAERKSRIEQMSGGSLQVSTEARLGNVVDELEEMCDAIQPFAVVMGSKNTGGLEQLLFGSTVVTAIKHLTVPVLVIPETAKFKPVQKIGLACDFKNVVPVTPEKEIHTVVKEFNAELHVLNVDDHKDPFKTNLQEQSTLLHNMLADLEPQYHFIDKDNIEEGLNEFADNNGLDFLIVIPKKHGMLEGLFHKGNAKKIALHSHVPVMAIHED